MYIPQYSVGSGIVINKTKNFRWPLKDTAEKAGSGSASIVQKYGTEDPDPNQNIADPDHGTGEPLPCVLIFLASPPGASRNQSPLPGSLSPSVSGLLSRTPNKEKKVQKILLSSSL
jgi:hypothetical protein